jgi:hypothetical protein
LKSTQDKALLWPHFNCSDELFRPSVSWRFPWACSWRLPEACIADLLLIMIFGFAAFHLGRMLEGFSNSPGSRQG